MRPEDDFQAIVVAYLRLSLPKCSWFCAVPNGSVLAGDKKRRGMQMNRLKKTGLIVGAPDLILCHDGRFLAIELKLPKTKLTDSQEIVEDAITLAGGGFAVCRSLDDVKRQLGEWGVIHAA